jgi:hypothetical protein
MAARPPGLLNGDAAGFSVEGVDALAEALLPWLSGTLTPFDCSVGVEVAAGCGAGVAEIPLTFGVCAGV